MKTYTHEELVSFLRQTPMGKILDSLFATELGLQEYATHWAAFQDVMIWNHEEGRATAHEELEDRVAEFVIEMGFYVNFEEAELNLTEVVK